MGPTGEEAAEEAAEDVQQLERTNKTFGNRFRFFLILCHLAGDVESGEKERRAEEFEASRSRKGSAPELRSQLRLGCGEKYGILRNDQ